MPEETRDGLFARISATGILLGIILAGGGFLRFFRLDQESYWLDELFTVRTAQLPLGDLIDEELAHGHLPAYGILTHFWQLPGVGEIWMRSLPAILGLFTIYFCYRLARELFSPAAGLWAAGFAAVSPFLVWYSRDATRYSWVILVSLLYLYTLSAAVSRNGRTWWGLCLATGALATLSYFYAGVLIAGSIFIVLLIPGCDRRRLRRWLVCTAALALLAVALFLVSSEAQKRIETVTPPPADAAGVLFDDLAAATSVMFRGYTGYEIGSGAQALDATLAEKTALVALFLLATVPLLLLKGERAMGRYRKIIALSLYALSITSGPILAHLVRGGLIAGRNIAWAAPVFLVIVAGVVTGIPRRIGAVLGAAVMAMLLFFTIAELGRDLNDDYRSITRILNENRQESDMLMCFPLPNCVAAEGFYLPQGLPLSGGFIVEEAGSRGVLLYPPGRVWQGHRFPDADLDFASMDGVELREQLERLLTGHNRLWVLSGDGRLGNLPAADAVYRELENTGWEEVESWHYSTLVLTEFERRLDVRPPT